MSWLAFCFNVSSTSLPKESTCVKTASTGPYDERTNGCDPESLHDVLTNITYSPASYLASVQVSLLASKAVATKLTLPPLFLPTTCQHSEYEKSSG